MTSIILSFATPGSRWRRTQRCLSGWYPSPSRPRQAWRTGRIGRCGRGGCWRTGGTTPCWTTDGGGGRPHS
eukprot:3919721-Pyramimonas_sp.AAC.1